MPGPGMWAAVVGLGALFCALGLFLTHSGQSLAQKPAGGFAKNGGLWSAGAGLAACVVWLLFVPILGWLVAAAMALFLAGLGAGNSLRQVIIITALVLGLLYIGLVGILHQHLPGGIIECVEITRRSCSGGLYFLGQPAWFVS